MTDLHDISRGVYRTERAAEQITARLDAFEAEFAPAARRWMGLGAMKRLGSKIR